MIDQLSIPLGEVPAATLRKFMGRRGQVIGAVFDRNAAQAPERSLHTRTQCLKALTWADRDRLPVRVRQNEVIKQVREPLAGDDHLELAHIRKIRLTLFAWHV